MKRRIISLLAILLLFSLLLCSCAEGLPLSELALAARDQTTLFSSHVENLLTDNAPLAANGKTEFALLYNKSAFPAVQNAVTAFCKSFKSYSGADLSKNDPKTSKRRILIGIAESDMAKEILETLSPASFYIGFSGKDLLILAHSDVMLCAALSYFCDTYLNEATAQTASRDVFWPNGLQYTAPTLICEDDSYTILRAERSGDGTVEAMSRLYETIRTASGARPVRKTDFNHKSTEREILLGQPDHPKANDILAALPRDGYYIGVQGETVLILAKNDLMLEKAVSRFLSLFVTARNASVDKGNKRIEFPAVCDYHHTEESILLAEDGINRAVLVYPAGASALLHSAIDSFCTLYKQLTNTDLPAYADNKYTRVDGVFEILVGRTERRESQKLYFDSIEKGAWRMAVDEDGTALAIAANGEFALRAAVEALGDALTSQTAALSQDSIYNRWQIKDGVDRLLYIFPDFANEGATVPDLSGVYSYKLYYYYYIMQQSNVGLPQYEEYGTVLKNAGFALTSQTDADSVHTSVYQSNTQTVSVTCDVAARSLRVQVSTRRGR